MVIDQYFNIQYSSMLYTKANLEKSLIFENQGYCTSRTCFYHSIHQIQLALWVGCLTESPFNMKSLNFAWTFLHSINT